MSEIYRLNISITKELHERMKLYPEVNFSRICREAITKELNELWAKREEIKLRLFLNE